MILNLKYFNTHVSYKKFKMETLQHILDLVTPFCFMGSVDFWDAYLTVSMHPDHFWFLCFEWQGKIYCYIVLPFGLAKAPRKFIKLLKPILRLLRTQGIVIVIYIDDSWIYGETFQICLQNITTAAAIFTRFGFIPHPKKSVLIPTQVIEVLGRVVNSVSMTVHLTTKKESSTLNLIKDLLAKKSPTIRFLTKVIGKLMSCFVVFPLGRAYYRSLEKVKVATLINQHGNFDAHCMLSSAAVEDLHWWLANLPGTSAPIDKGNPSIEIFSDASDARWGSFMSPLRIQGHFTLQEQEFSINTRETIAILYAMCSFLPYIRNRHVML